MKKFLYVLRWIGVTIFGIMAITAISEGSFLGALLLILGGMIIAPLGFVFKIRSKLKLKKALTIVLSVLLLFAGILTLPDNNSNSSNESNSQISSNYSSETATVSYSAVSSESTSSETSEADNDELESVSLSTDSASSVEPTVTSDTSTSHSSSSSSKITSSKSTSSKAVSSKATSQNNSKTVYITKTGKTYHSSKQCTGLNFANEIYETTLSEAEKKGLKPCSKCH